MPKSEHAILGPNPVIPSPRSFLIQICNLCNEEMLLDTGDVIYGDTWYHSTCWLKAEGERQIPHVAPEPLIIIDE